MAVVATVAGGPFLRDQENASTRGTYRSRATAAIGSLSNFGEEWWDYAFQAAASTQPPGWTQATVTAQWSSASQIAGTSGGWHRISIVAGGGVTAVIQQYTNTPLIANAGTQKAYVAHRFQCGGALAADQTQFFGLHNIGGNRSIGIGAIGALHASNFVFTYDNGYNSGAASVVNTGIAVDANPHVAEWWLDGANGLWCRFDGVLLPKATMASAPTDGLYLINDVRSTNAVSSPSWSRDWYYVAFPRT